MSLIIVAGSYLKLNPISNTVYRGPEYSVELEGIRMGWPQNSDPV